MKSSYRATAIQQASRLALIASAMGSITAFAQEEGLARNDAGLADIVVTARKVAENLQDVPVAITAFSGEQLQQQSAVKVEDIARLTPALTIRNANTTNAALAVQLRGQLQSDPLATLDPSVGVYVDGYYVARTYGENADLLDLQSAQILKGPQGTLFGRNTTGGAILLQTNDPDFNGFSGLVSATYGRFDDRRGTAVVNLPIVDDRLALRLAYNINKRDGFVKETQSGKKLGQVDSWTGRAKLLFKATDNLSFLLSAERFESTPFSLPYRLEYLRPDSVAAALQASRTVYGPTGTPAQGFALLADYQNFVNSGDVVSLTDLPLQEVKTQTYISTTTLDTFFGAIKFIGGYRKIKANSPNDLDGSVYDILTSTGTQDLQQYSGEFQITGTALDDKIDFAGGYLFFHEDGFDQSVNTPLRLVSGAATSRNIFRGEVVNESHGFYGQATWHLTDKLSFTGGLRYSVDDKQITIRNRTIRLATDVVTCSLLGAAPPTCPLTRKDAFDAVSYTAGLDYKVNDDVLIYIKNSKGYRSGGQNLRSAGTLAGFIPFEPEIARSTEGGLKSELFNRRVRLNVAGYYTRVSNIQRTTIVTFPVGSPVATATIVGNAGKTRVYGGEFEASAIVAEGFELGATGAYTNAKYLSYFDPNSGIDRSHERFDGVPEWTLSVSASYTHRFDFGRLMLRTDYSRQAETALQTFNTYDGPCQVGVSPAGAVCDATLGIAVNADIAARIKAATTQKEAGVLNARIALTVMDDKLELAVFGRNITNERPLTTSNYLPPALGLVVAERREPTTYGATISYKF